MAFHHRKLIVEAINVSVEICPSSCDPTPDHCCPDECLNLCPSTCFYPLSLPSLSPNNSPSNSHKPSSALIITLALLATFFLLVCLSALFLKRYYYYRRRHRRTQSENRLHHDFIDEDHGPMVVVDHPIWSIRTVGLQPSVIASIAVFKYGKKGDGLVDGTDCAVCLCEFREGETLRLLPKCNHAFHISCIDTWLRSHTNCPMCRAGIVVIIDEVPAAQLPEAVAGSSVSAQLGISDENEELGRGMEEGRFGELGFERGEETELGFGNGTNICENLKEDEANGNPLEAVDDVQPMRRSVSMDSLAATMISVALANVGPVESAAYSNARSEKIVKSNMGIFPKGADGNQSLLRVMGSSTTSSSRGRYLQSGPMSLKRSLSCGAKLFLSRYGRS